MAEQYVKNQHYIAQCLLKFFANSKDQVFEALVESGKVYSTNYKNSMVERFTYEHPALERNIVEKYFHKIESYIGDAVQRIIDTIEKHEIGECPFSEVKKALSQYMREFIIFYYRSGALLTEFEFERKIKADRVFVMLKKVMNSPYIRELSKTVINYYNFSVIKSENNEFILSDQYLASVALGIKNRFFNISNRHIGLRDMMLLIPLSGKYYAVFSNGFTPKYILSNKVNILNQFQVDEINEAIINNSYTKCISYRQDSLQRILIKFEYKSPSATMAGGNGIHMGTTLKKEVFFFIRDKKAWKLITEIAPYEWDRYKNIGRNDSCPCKSSKKYKNCCSDALCIAMKIIAPFAAKQQFPFAQIDKAKDTVSVDTVIEMPIYEYSGI
ncbi:DUF4238 domain-containing protein [Ruminiclostridium cellobioparum]|uniref:SecC motif-containing protein n=1 Tax=Ruminiclostridium cellobioparum subsp. termitidis CT1112 TaxID=1195236 RepID=S0FT52_RUMCE|nr:DUF4238 domain-containing protein [Ruminiclostridium cellobioparum]EMS73511.1 SecC motif-containing protein [Ruminiclostridium cellobioparum subsp. termitidis CT1112]